MYDKFGALTGSLWCRSSAWMILALLRSRCLLRQEKYLLYLCYFCTEEGKIVTSVCALQWVVGLTISFVFTAHDFSLLNCGTSWRLLKGFILEAAFRYVYLSWSLPLAPVAVLLFSHKKCQAGSSQLWVCLCQIGDCRQDQVCLCSFFWCIWPAITLKLTWTYFCRPKREKKLKVSGISILAVLR